MAVWLDIYFGVWIVQQEFLFPPLSYLEVVGEVSYMTTKLGAVRKVVCFPLSYSNIKILSDAVWYYDVSHDINSCQVIRIIPLQIIANLKSPGLEELIGMRKKLHIDRLLSRSDFRCIGGFQVSGTGLRSVNLQMQKN